MPLCSNKTSNPGATDALEPYQQLLTLPAHEQTVARLRELVEADYQRPRPRAAALRRAGRGAHPSTGGTIMTWKFWVLAIVLALGISFVFIVGAGAQIGWW